MSTYFKHFGNVTIREVVEKTSWKLVDKEVIIDQEKKNSFDIEISYNTFKKRYSELCDKNKEPIILKLFKILITNNPNKNMKSLLDLFIFYFY